MATIKAFRAIHPHFNNEASLVFAGGTTAGASANSLASLKDKLEQQPVFVFEEHPAGTLYEQIPSNLDMLIKNGTLETSDSAAIYIYEIAKGIETYTGVWTLTSFNDFRTGHVKKHESTRAGEVDNLKQYRLQAGLEVSPVLITYQPDVLVNALIMDIKASLPSFIQEINGAEHRFWKIDEQIAIAKFTHAFNKLGTVYLADGHHRTSAVEQMLLEKYGDVSFPNDDPAVYFSSLYMAADQIKILAYHKHLKPGALIDTERVFQIIRKKFEIIRSRLNMPVEPVDTHHFGMYINGHWYELKAKEDAFKMASFTDQLDASILNTHILWPAFGVSGACADSRLSSIGGRDAMDQLIGQLNQDATSIGFTLCPVSVNQLLSVAYTDGLMPRKTTWVEPKIPFGLLMYHFNQPAL
jgi:uncharacterized protein (DUF1015 family)